MNYLDEGTGSKTTTAKFPSSGQEKRRSPGDIISDLERAKLIGDPLFELNFLVNNTLWNDYQWNYETNFTVSSSKESHSRFRRRKDGRSCTPTTYYSVTSRISFCVTSFHWTVRS